MLLKGLAEVGVFYVEIYQLTFVMRTRLGGTRTARVTALECVVYPVEGV